MSRESGVLESKTSIDESIPVSKLPASIAACMAAAVELDETRTLVNALQAENRALTERLATEKDAVIASQDKLVEALKTKKPSPWRRIGDILIAAAAIAVLK